MGRLSQGEKKRQRREFKECLPGVEKPTGFLGWLLRFPYWQKKDLGGVKRLKFWAKAANKLEGTRPGVEGKSRGLSSGPGVQRLLKKVGKINMKKKRSRSENKGLILKELATIVNGMAEAGKSSHCGGGGGVFSPGNRKLKDSNFEKITKNKEGRKKTRSNNVQTHRKLAKETRRKIGLVVERNGKND